MHRHIRPTMTSSMQTYLKLLALATGSEEVFDIAPEQIDWPSVIRMAMTDGLDALTFDGVKVLYKRQPEMAERLDASTGDLKYEWLGYALQVEQDYKTYLKRLRALAAFYNEEGFRMLILKGYGLSLEYPVPAHRPTGDIDVYLYGRGAEADERVRERLGVEVDQSQVMHSVFRFQGVSVEDHASFLNVASHRCLRPLEEFLEQEALNAKELVIGGYKVYVPTPQMNAVYLLCHMSSHFVYNGLLLKQVLDWAVFLRRHGASIDWDKVMQLAHKTGRFELFRAFNGIVVDHFEVPASVVPDWGRDLALEDRIWEDVLAPRREMVGRSVWKKATDLLASRWRYRLTYRESFGLYFLKRAWANISRGIPGVQKKVWE